MKNKILFNKSIDAKPSPDEADLYNQLTALLVQPAPSLLESLKNYRSASDFIRDAIASPTPENEDKAWDAVSPTVDMLRDFYEYASELGKYYYSFLVNYYPSSLPWG